MGLRVCAFAPRSWRGYHELLLVLDPREPVLLAFEYVRLDPFELALHGLACGTLVWVRSLRAREGHVLIERARDREPFWVECQHG